MTGSGSGDRALRARAVSAQRRERVEPRVVAIAPRGCDGISADRLHRDQAGLLPRERRVRIQPAWLAHLAPAVGARAEPPEADEVVERDMPVRPLDPQPVS